MIFFFSFFCTPFSPATMTSEQKGDGSSSCAGTASHQSRLV